MQIKKLFLSNFRNYSKLELGLDERPTILTGNNAVGKSNLLEAIYLLSTTKSQRVDSESELIKQGESLFRVEGVVGEEDGEDTTLEIVTQNSNEEGFSKRLKVNGVGRRVVDFIGNLPAVIFYPSDINMVTGPPNLRRWHLDLALAQIDLSYKKALTLYEQHISARNKLLKAIKEGESKVDELTFWTDELIKNGVLISDARAAFFQNINITQPLGNFVFEYKQSLITSERSKEYQSKEIAAGVTLIGPHRDDFTLKLADRNLAHFGSRGEQRTATLSFKLAQLEYMALTLGKKPILLLDDVFSELDATHRASVVEIVSRQQTIIAIVELENIPKEFLSSARILKVENGKVIE